MNFKHARGKEDFAVRMSGAFVEIKKLERGTHGSI